MRTGRIQLKNFMMENEHKLLFYDMGNVYIGKEKLSEGVYLEGGGDWDFTLSTITTDKNRGEFDNILMCGNDYYYSVIDPPPQNWCEICNLLGVHFATKEYMWKKCKLKIEVVSHEHDSTGFESYLPFDELHDWHTINNDGNFHQLTCEWNNNDPHTYILFTFATS